MYSTNSFQFSFQAAGIRLGSTIMSICSLLTGVIIAFIYGWKLTLVILCFVPALAVAGALQMKMLTGAAGKNREALEVAGKVSGYIVLAHMSRVMRKPKMLFTNRSDTNQAIQAQKMARGWKF